MDKEFKISRGSVVIMQDTDLVINAFFWKENNLQEADLFYTFFADVCSDFPVDVNIDSFIDELEEIVELTDADREKIHEELFNSVKSMSC